MQSLLLIAMMLGSAPSAGERMARALPCGPRFVPMAIRIAAVEPRMRPTDRLVQRRNPQRRAPCFRLASA